MGVAVTSVLFLRWLNFYGISGAALHAVGRNARDIYPLVSELMAGSDRSRCGGDRHFGDARPGRGIGVNGVLGG